MFAELTRTNLSEGQTSRNTLGLRQCFPKTGPRTIYIPLIGPQKFFLVLNM